MNIAVDPQKYAQIPLSFGTPITIAQHFPRNHRPGRRIMARVRRRGRKHSDWPSRAETYMDIVDRRIMAETLVALENTANPPRQTSGKAVTV